MNSYFSDVHLSRVVTWAVQALGKAFLIGVGISFSIALIGGLISAALSPLNAFGEGLVLLGIGLGPLVSACYLAFASAPYPVAADYVDYADHED